MVRVRAYGREIARAVGPDYELAKQTLVQMQAAMEREHALGIKEVARVSFAEFHATVAPVLRARHRPTTVAAELGRYAVLSKHFGDVPLTDIKASEVTDFLAHLVNDLGFTHATTNRYLSLLSVVFQEAIARSCARENPTRKVRRAKEDLLDVPYLSGADVQRIIDLVPPHHRPLVAIAAETGMRRSELLELRWPAVDLVQGVLRVVRSKTKRPRTVPMTAKARQVLESIRPADPGEGQVFGTWSPSTPSKVFRRAADAAGFKTLRLHGLRHILASALLRSGATVTEVGEILGDTSPATILRYARHAPTRAVSDAMARLAAERSGSGSVGELLSGYRSLGYKQGTGGAAA